MGFIQPKCIQDKLLKQDLYPTVIERLPVSLPKPLD